MISQIFNLNNYPPIMVAVMSFAVGALVVVAVEFFRSK